MMDKLSIITVCFNVKDSLEKTIQSVINQSYKNIEYIIVDGCSTDGSVEVIKKYEKYVTKWISEPDQGIYDAMNKGIMMATGKWLNFMNAGDVFSDSNVLSAIFSLNIPDEKNFLYSNYWEPSPVASELNLHITNRAKGVVHHQSSIYKRVLHQRYGLYLTQKPYSVYDLLFFLSIPSCQFMKVPYEIAIIEPGGISEKGIWAWERAEAVRVALGIKSMNKAFVTLLKIRLRNSLPFVLRRLIGKYLLKHKSRSL